MDTSILLGKTRRLLLFFQKDTGKRINYQDTARTLKEVIPSGVYLIDPGGKIEGCALAEDFKCQVLETRVLQKQCFPLECIDLFLRNNPPATNLLQEPYRCVFFEGLPCGFEDINAVHIPISCGETRQGTLLQPRRKKAFGPEELVLAEIGAALLGRKILNGQTRERNERERHKEALEQVVRSLSYSEEKALKSILQGLGGLEENLVCSKTARRYGVSYHAVRTTLRKLESAGIIKTSNLGHKGVHISVLNPYLYEYAKETEAADALAVREKPPPSPPTLLNSMKY